MFILFWKFVMFFNKSKVIRFRSYTQLKAINKPYKLLVHIDGSPYVKGYHGYRERSINPINNTFSFLNISLYADLVDACYSEKRLTYYQNIDNMEKYDKVGIIPVSIILI